VMALYWDPQEIFVRIGPRQESAEGRRAYHEEYTGSSLQRLQQSNNTEIQQTEGAVQTANTICGHPL